MRKEKDAPELHGPLSETAFREEAVFKRVVVRSRPRVALGGLGGGSERAERGELVGCSKFRVVLGGLYGLEQTSQDGRRYEKCVLVGESRERGQKCGLGEMAVGLENSKTFTPRLDKRTILLLQQTIRRQEERREWVVNCSCKMRILWDSVPT